MDRKDLYNIVIARKLSGGGGGGDVPSELRNEMNSVFNEKFQTSIDYPPEEWAATVELMEPYPTDTASGSIATFDTSLALPLVECKAQIVATQSGTGDPSPSNVRPISGWTACKVTRTGKNLIPSEGWTEGYYIAADGTPTESASSHYSGLIKVNSGDTYVLSGHSSPTSGGSKRVHGYDANGNWVQQVNYVQVGANVDFQTSGTIPSGIAYIRISVVTADTNIMYEVGSNATTYKAYNGTEYEIDLDGTIYVGELDVKRGVLTITYGFVDLNSFTWNKDSNQSNPNGTYYTAVGDFSAFANYTSIKSNVGVAGNGNIPTSPANSFWFNGARTGIRWIWGSPQGGSSLSDLETFLQNNTCYLIAELVTPIEVSLTPEEITTLVGANNIWADTGDIEVEFKLTHQDWVDQHTSPEPNLLTKSAQIEGLQSKLLESVENDDMEEATRIATELDNLQNDER